MPGRAPEEFGSYLVYEQLGIGGMASVHLAESRSTGGFRKRVALKRLLPHAAANPELVDAFIHEARLVRYLHHANIAQTYDFGKVGDIYFMAMEFVSGATLGQLLRQCTAAAGQIPVPIALAILVQLCDALDHAHNLCDETGKPLEIIHRDVSPPNIIVSNTGLVKLIDFGIAKAASSSVQTQAGVIKGKFGYVAPEYLAGKIDARADLWAVGVIAHELLTMQQLFKGSDDFLTMHQVREMAIEPPSRTNPKVPPDLDAIVMTALQRIPDLRWQSASAMCNALAGVQQELGEIMGNQQVIEWVEWAFTQEPPKSEQSGLSQLISALEQPSQPVLSISTGSGLISGSPDAFGDERRLSAPRIGAAMLGRRKSRRVTWLLLLLLAVTAAAAIAIKDFGLPLPI